MPSLAFFPWLTIQEPVDFERLHLLIYKRGGKPSGPGSDLQKAIDAVLKPFMDTANASINNAVIIQLDGKEINVDLSEEDRGGLFESGEIIAASGLSARQFFTSGRYCNRDDFLLEQIDYQHPKGGMVFRRRRRDGHRTTFVIDSSCQFNRPLNTSSNNCVELDMPFAEALFRAREKTHKWNIYLDAIFGFNQATTDNERITEMEEVVLLMGAYHKLLEETKENKLALKFKEKIGRYLKKGAASSKRYNAPNQAPSHSLGEAWLREFQQVRHLFGHGSTSAKTNTRWKIKEHLLIGTYLFPLLLKTLLSEEGLYTLTKNDELDLEIFEERIDVDFFTPIQKRYGQS